MRKVFLFVLAIAIAAGLHAQEDKKQTIEGNGKKITREVSVTSFDALKASGAYELKLSQGNTESVKIEADENLQDYFTVTNEGNKLTIDTRKLKNLSLKTKNRMKVFVTFKQLKELELNTVGNVASEEQLTFSDLQMHTKSVGNVELKLTANKLDLKNNSVGNVKLDGKAQDAMVKNSGVGNLNAGNFVVQKMNIENSGVGNATVNAEKDLKVKDSFLGKVKNKGAAPVRKMNKVKV